MIEIRLHGRGGQGAVVASEVLAHAARRHGFHVQVFPEFGVERRGAPVVAFARLSDTPIRLRTRVRAPHHVIVLDAALPRQVDVTEGLRPGGVIVVNADDPRGVEPLAERYRVATVDATAIAVAHGIGTPTAPIVNTTILGTFAAATGLVTLADVTGGIADAFGEGPVAARNGAAAADAHGGWRWVAPFATRALQALFTSEADA